jgi:hypothetical protein
MPRVSRSLRISSAREVAALARVAPFGDQPLDLVNRHRRPRVLRLPKLHDPKDLVEVVERLLDQHGIGLPPRSW